MRSCLHICAILVLWCLFWPCVCNVVTAAVVAGKGVPEADMEMQVEQLLREINLFVPIADLHWIIWLLVSCRLCGCCSDDL